MPMPEYANPNLDQAISASPGMPAGTWKHASPSTTPEEVVLNSTPDDGVGTRSIAYQEMMLRWELPIDLMGGTLTMRAKAHKWVPKETREAESQWRNRIARAVLYPAYKQSVKRLSERPFIRPMLVKNESTLPPRVKAILTNADGTGQPLSALAQEILASAIHFGLTHVLVDMPAVPPKDAVAEKDHTPSLTHIPPTSLIGWDTETDVNGKERLTAIRIWEQHIERRGYAETRCDYVRVIEPTKWTLYKKTITKDPKGIDKVEWKQDAEGVNTLGRIALHTLYCNRTGHMQGTPCLEDLAWMNCTHFESSAEQRNILRFARVGILFATGMSTEEMTGMFEIGPSTLLGSNNPEATLQYVEHKGEAIAAGRQDLMDLEARMEVLGLEPMMQKKANTSATGLALEETKTESALQQWVRSLQQMLENAFKDAAQWVGSSLPDGFQIQLLGDFSMSPRTRDNILALLEAWVRGAIDHLTLLEEWRRLGIINEDTPLAEVVESARLEAAERSLQATGIIDEVLAGTSETDPSGATPDGSSPGGTDPSAGPEGGISRLGGTGVGIRKNLNDSNGGKSRFKNQGNPATNGQKAMAGRTGL